MFCERHCYENKMTDWKRIFAKHDKGLVSKIYKEIFSTIRKQITQLKWEKIHKQTSHQRRYTNIKKT